MIVISPNTKKKNGVDYFENDAEQTDEVMTEMFQKMRRRANHNVWEVVDFRGTSATKNFAKQWKKSYKANKILKFI